MSFEFPYHSRVMLRYPGQEPVELHRYKRRMVATDLRIWEADRDPSAEIFVEHRQPEKHLIGPRPIPGKILYVCDQTAREVQETLGKVQSLSLFGT